MVAAHEVGDYAVDETDAFEAEAVKLELRPVNGPAITR
jgi:hypothetical protein